MVITGKQFGVNKNDEKKWCYVDIKWTLSKFSINLLSRIFSGRRLFLLKVENMKQLDTEGDFNEFIRTNKFVVIDFTAKWCGPCKAIGPKFEAMVEKYPAIQFAKVDVDENEETPQKLDISCMPTFKFFKDGQVNEDLTVVGANIENVETSLSRLTA